MFTSAVTGDGKTYHCMKRQSVAVKRCTQPKIECVVAGKFDTKIGFRNVAVPRYTTTARNTAVTGYFKRNRTVSQDVAVPRHTTPTITSAVVWVIFALDITAETDISLTDFKTKITHVCNTYAMQLFVECDRLSLVVLFAK